MCRLLAVIGCAIGLLPMASAHASFLRHDGVQQFIDHLARKDDFNAGELRGLFKEVERQADALDAMREPAESLPWHRYRAIFITPERVTRGAKFLRDHAATLARAERRFGVPPEIITAIIGVESFYGRHKGGYPVFDTLATLAFDYPPRADFFRGELADFLRLARSERLPPRSVQGSYAGAMGMAQFIPSSYRAYAVDFDDDDQRDLFTSVDDAIGSVAAYFDRHGWRPGGPVAERVEPSDKAYRELLHADLKPQTGAKALRKTGLGTDPPLAADERVRVFELQGEFGTRVWIGRHNFYVITRYNHSALYAMAVHQLAQRILQRTRPEAVR